ncbi:MAG: hypothetical protein ACRYFX_24135 [Janthinobacterium lividum]
MLGVLAFPVVYIGFKNQPGWALGLPFFLIAFGVLSFLFGTNLASRLVFRAGTAGTGEVVSTYATSTQVNSHNVRGYRVLLRTAQGQTLETTFDDVAFPVYPADDFGSYPAAGEKFNTRYLPDYPQDFVVLSNDDSPWAHGQQCEALLDSLHEARTRHEFDLANAASKQTYVGLIHRVIARQCYTDSTDLHKYYGDLAHVQLEPCQALLDSLDVLRIRYNADVTDLANDAAYLALIRRVIARPACYTDSADVRKYYDDIRRVQKAEAGVQAGAAQ